MAKGKKKNDKKSKKGKKGGEDKFAGARPFCVAPVSTFEVHSFRVHWISADPGYDPRYRLTPIINLFESDAETRHEGAVAFLQFRRASEVEGAAHEEGSKVYRMDYPLSMVDSVLTLLGSGTPLEVAYFEQEGRKWADLRTPFLGVGDDDEEFDEYHEHEAEDDEPEIEAEDHDED